VERRLSEKVLEKLDCPAPPTTLAGLCRLYGAWCRKVPFDNVRKLIHVRRGDPARLPGDTPEDFFEAWLAHGSGGTCWAGNGALRALLDSLGFAAQGAVATMLVTPDLPPNHGSVVVAIDGERWVVDASILHCEPLPMRESQTSAIDHRAWGVQGFWVGGQFRIRWRNFLAAGRPLDCAFGHVGASAEEFSQRHEATRGWSPFNFGLCLNLVHGERRIGAANGCLTSFDETGAAHQRPADLAERRRFLIEDIGMSEELVCQLPDDLPFAPPPQ
jgi:N-hydroxyarylamine O-acetyltransferase